MPCRGKSGARLIIAGAKSRYLFFARLMVAKKLSGVAGQRSAAPFLIFREMGIKTRGPPDGLCGIVNQDVETSISLLYIVGKDLNARNMPQIEAMNMQPVSPCGEPLFVGIPERRVNGKSGRRDHRGAGAQHHERCLIADLHSCAGNEG